MYFFLCNSYFLFNTFRVLCCKKYLSNVRENPFSSISFFIKQKKKNQNLKWNFGDVFLYCFFPSIFIIYFLYHFFYLFCCCYFCNFWSHHHHNPHQPTVNYSITNWILKGWKFFFFIFFNFICFSSLPSPSKFF